MGLHGWTAEGILLLYLASRDYLVLQLRDLSEAERDELAALLRTRLRNPNRAGAIAPPPPLALEHPPRDETLLQVRYSL